MAALAGFRPTLLPLPAVSSVFPNPGVNIASTPDHKKNCPRKIGQNGFISTFSCMSRWVSNIRFLVFPIDSS